MTHVSVKKLFSCWATIVALLGVTLASAQSAGSQKNSQGSSQAFLAQFPKIRILVVDAPAYGHQMTAVSWVYRLREIGFKGEIELVVEENAESKLKQLMPELPWPVGSIPPGGIYFSKLHARALAFSDLHRGLKAGTSEPVGLAIIPAEDWFHGQSVVRSRRPGKPTPKEELGARQILRMQPPGWKDGFRSFEIENGTELSFEELKDLPLWQSDQPGPSDSSLDQMLRWLNEIQPYGDSKIHRRLAHLLTAQNAKEMLFYCAHIEKVVYLTRIVVAVQQLKPNETVRIWVASGFTDFQWKNLNLAIQRQVSRSDAIRLVDLGEEISIPRFQGDYRGVEVIRLASAPPALVRYLGQRSSLPPAVTGRYSQNLMFQLGKPYVELKFFDELQSALNLSGDILQSAQALTRELNEEMSTADFINVEQSLQRFWSLAETPEGVRQYSSRKLSNPANGLVDASLRKCSELLLKRP